MCACVCTRRLRLLRVPRSSRVARGISPQPAYVSWQEVPHYWKQAGRERHPRVGAVPESLARLGVQPGLDVNFELQPWIFREDPGRSSGGSGLGGSPAAGALGSISVTRA